MWHTDPEVARAGATGEAGFTIPTPNGTITLHVDTRDPKGWKAHHNCGGRLEKEYLMKAYEMALSPGKRVPRGQGEQDGFNSTLICPSCSVKLAFTLEEQMSFSKLKSELRKERHHISQS